MHCRYNTTSGEHLGSLDPNSRQPAIGGAGWTDIIYGVNAYFMKDGSVAVFEEEVFYEKVIVYRIPPGWC
jgi:hypothetical protein